MNDPSPPWLDIRTEILEAWSTLPVPSLSEAISPDTSLLRETAAIEKYFADRSIEAVNPGDRKIRGEMPFLIGFTDVGRVYYTAAYLLYCLETLRIYKSAIDFFCDTAILTFTEFLRDNHAHGLPFTEKQKELIGRVLTLAASELGNSHTAQPQLRDLQQLASSWLHGGPAPRP